MMKNVVFFFIDGQMNISLSWNGEMEADASEDFVITNENTQNKDHETKMGVIYLVDYMTVWSYHSICRNSNCLTKSFFCFRS